MTSWAGLAVSPDDPHPRGAKNTDFFASVYDKLAILDYITAPRHFVRYLV